MRDRGVEGAVRRGIGADERAAEQAGDRREADDSGAAVPHGQQRGEAIDLGREGRMQGRGVFLGERRFVVAAGQVEDRLRGRSPRRGGEAQDPAQRVAVADVDAGVGDRGRQALQALPGRLPLTIVGLCRGRRIDRMARDEEHLRVEALDQPRGEFGADAAETPGDDVAASAPQWECVAARGLGCMRLEHGHPAAVAAPGHFAPLALHGQFAEDARRAFGRVVVDVDMHGAQSREFLRRSLHERAEQCALGVQRLVAGDACTAARHGKQRQRAAVRRCAGGDVGECARHCDAAARRLACVVGAAEPDGALRCTSALCTQRLHDRGCMSPKPAGVDAEVAWPEAREIAARLDDRAIRDKGRQRLCRGVGRCAEQQHRGRLAQWRRCVAPAPDAPVEPARQRVFVGRQHVDAPQHAFMLALQQALAQRAALDLADRRLGDVLARQRHDHGGADAEGLRHLLADRAQQVGQLALAVQLGHEEQREAFAAVGARVGDRAGGGVGACDARQLFDRGLDGRAGVVGPVDNDDVLVAAGDRQASVVDARQVAGAEPAVVRERLRARLRRAEIAVEHGGARQLQLADLAFAQQAPFVVDHPHAHAGHGAPDLDERVGVGRRVEPEAIVVGHPRADLRHAPGGHHHVRPQAAGGEQLQETPRGRGDDRLAAVEDAFDRCQVARLARQLVGVAADEAEGEVRRERHLGAMALQQVEPKQR